eukprot:Skav201383  [mRNA]  locus=scaffold3514:238788:251242:+ [translate_table: standard]
MTTLLSVLLSVTVASATRTSSQGSVCCINAETDYKPQTLMKICEFVLSDPYAASDAERLKESQKCMERMRLGELQLPDMKIKKLPEDSDEFSEAAAVASAYMKANLTMASLEKSWFKTVECPPGMVELKDKVLKSWRCDKLDLQSVELALQIPVSRFSNRKETDRIDDLMDDAKSGIKQSKERHEKFQRWKEEQEEYIAKRKVEKAKEDKLLNDAKEKMEKYAAKFG